MSDEVKTEVKQEESGPVKNKKIRFMSFKELEQAVEKTNKEQGGLVSRYAQELLKRRDFIMSSQEK